ncbi:MAG: hypothetical protein IAE92_05860 [Burkholderiaceae bacterium]|nr:hypothetical protein [Burkholderiaceae bacterium]
MATLQELRSQRELVYAAYQKALTSQEYTVGQGVTARRNRRADFEALRTELAELDGRIARAEFAANPRARRILYLRPRA